MTAKPKTKEDDAEPKLVVKKVLIRLTAYVARCTKRVDRN